MSTTYRCTNAPILYQINNNTMGQGTDFKTLQAQYKKLLNDAYQMSKCDQQESVKLYAQADQMRKSLFSF